jgi:hypothetical protein
MSALLPASLSHLAGSGLFTLLGALAATLLVILVVEREMLRVYGQPYAHRARVINIAIIPLLFVFAVVVVEFLYRLIFL